MIFMDRENLMEKGWSHVMSDAPTLTEQEAELQAFRRKIGAPVSAFQPRGSWLHLDVMRGPRQKALTDPSVRVWDDEREMMKFMLANVLRNNPKNRSTVNTLTAWSYSRLSTYEKCALQARYKYIDKLPEPESDALTRGGETHDTLAQYLRGDLPPDGSYEPSIVPGWTYFGRLLNDLRDLRPEVEQQWGYDRQWRPTGWFGKDTWFRSVLDASLVYEDNTGDVIDFKTGKPYPQDTAKQAELYAISMVRRFHALTHVTVRFWYVDLAQKGAEAVYRFSREQAESAMPRWEKKAERMLSDEIMAPRPGEHCRFCPFAKSKGGPCKYG